MRTVGYIPKEDGKKPNKDTPKGGREKKVEDNDGGKKP